MSTVGFVQSHIHHITAPFDKPVKTQEKDVIIQFSVKLDPKAECPGGSVKILPPFADKTNGPDDFTPRLVFGPHICQGKRNLNLTIFSDEKQYLLSQKPLPVSEKDGKMRNIFA